MTRSGVRSGDEKRERSSVSDWLQVVLVTGGRDEGAALARSAVERRADLFLRIVEIGERHLQRHAFRMLIEVGLVW